MLCILQKFYSKLQLVAFIMLSSCVYQQFWWCKNYLDILSVGILALTRQWKNQLYMPVLASTQARRRRGAFTVHFDIPKGM